MHVKHPNHPLEFLSHLILNVEHGYISPARLAYHILHGTKYYLEDTSAVDLPSGRTFGGDWLTMEKHELPLRSDILHALKTFRAKTERWLANIEMGAKNTSFDWAGETKSGVVIFLLRHILYNSGELNALLYESKNGNAEDYWIKAFW